MILRMTKIIVMEQHLRAERVLIKSNCCSQFLFYHIVFERLIFHKTRKCSGFENSETFARAATPRLSGLLRALRKSSSLSARVFSLLLSRDHKSMYGDVAKLLKVGLIDRIQEGLIEVTWDGVTTKPDLMVA